MRRLLLLAFIWGWSFLFIKVAVEGMTPTTVAAGRIGLGMLVLVAILRARGQSLPRDPTLWRHFFVAGLIGNAVPFSLLAWGEERITSALTAVVNASTPLFTAVFVAVILGERLRRGQIAGLGVGLAGVAVAAGVGSADLAHSSMSGALASAGAGGCYGLAFAYMKKYLTDVPPMLAAAGQLTAATVLMAPFAVVTTAVSGIDLAPRRLLALLALGAVGTGLAYVLNYRVLAELGPTRASLVTYIIPVVAVAVGVVVLGEPFHSRLLTGGVLIVVGIALVHRRLRLWRRRRPLVGASLMLVVLPLLLLAACGGDDGAARGGDCSPVRTERLDPESGLHLLPNAPEPNYETDPPTSGPHLSGAVPSGAVDEPIARPAQVALLERGVVLVQYRDVGRDAVTELEALAADDVVVAPNPDLPAAVVATAWRTKQTCTTIDLGVLESFIREHAGRGAEGHE